MVYLNGEDKDWVSVETELIWDDDNVAPSHCMSQPCRRIFNIETIQPAYWHLKIFECLEMEGLGPLGLLTSQVESWHEQVEILFPSKLKPPAEPSFSIQSKQNILLHAITENTD